MILQITTCLNALSQLEQANGFSPVCPFVYIQTATFCTELQKCQNLWDTHSIPDTKSLNCILFAALLCSLAFCHSGGTPEANRWQHCLST